MASIDGVVSTPRGDPLVPEAFMRVLRTGSGKRRRRARVEGERELWRVVEIFYMTVRHYFAEVQAIPSRRQATESLKGADTTPQKDTDGDFLRGMQQIIEQRLDHINVRLDFMEKQTKEAESVAARRHMVVEQQLRSLLHASGITDDGVAAAGDDAEDRKRLKVRRRP
jgi:hypothetical protein